MRKIRSGFTTLAAMIIVTSLADAGDSDLPGFIVDESYDISAEAARGCDDNNPCTIDVRRSTPIVQCQHIRIRGCSLDKNGDVRLPPGGLSKVEASPWWCSDNNGCTLDTMASGGCKHLYLSSGFPCADKNLCNGGETCNGAGACRPGTPVPVDDGNPCTVDACDPATGAVTHSPSPAGALCSNGNPCDGDETCNASGQCLAGVVPPAGSTSCDDKDPCTDADECDGNGACHGTGKPLGDACWHIDGTVATTLSQELAGYLATNPQGVVIADTGRLSVVRGQVKNVPPLSGVKITVRDHPEFGSTTTRADGTFDLVVNGGEVLDVVYEHAGYLPVHRRVRAPWNDWVWATDVTMTAVPQAGATFTSGYGAPSPVLVDATPGHNVLVAIPAGTLVQCATCTNPDEYEIRVANFTPTTDATAMPAELPPTSAYTYAIELQLWHQQTLVEDFSFSNPVYLYTSDIVSFAGGSTESFPIGSAVPAASYDRVVGVWDPVSIGGHVTTGVVVHNLSTGFDTNGDGAADEYGPAFPEAGLLPSPAVYWRVPITHFSPWDLNWPFTLPPGATGWQGAPSGEGKQDKGCSGPGSIVGCENQTLGERIAIAGTPYSLVYQSDRVRGRKASYTLDVPLDVQDPKPTNIFIEVLLGGRREKASYAAPQSSLVHRFVWDGMDAYGHQMQGEQPVTVRVGYAYTATYVPGSSFGMPMGYSVETVPARDEAVLWREWKGRIGAWNAVALQLGGWSIDVHHAYAPRSNTLYMGDGRQRTVEGVGIGVYTITGNDSGCLPQDYAWKWPAGVAIDADGTVFVADSGNTGASNGVVAKKGPGDPAPIALVPALGFPVDIALSKDGSLYVCEQESHRVIRLPKQGGASDVVVGDGTQGSSSDGTPGKSTKLNTPGGIAIGPDGALYVADTNNNRVLRAELDTLATTVVVAGGGSFVGEDITAKTAYVDHPMGLSFGLDGTMYVACRGVVRAVSPSGIIRTVAGGGAPADGVGDGVLATQAALPTTGAIGVHAGWDGALYISQSLGHARIRKVGTDGFISTVAGTDEGSSACAANGTSPTRMKLAEPHGVALAPDGSLVFADAELKVVRRIASALPGVLGTEIPVPSEDGSEIFVFDQLGRHLRTRDALTGKTLLSFKYNPYGADPSKMSSLLTSIKDERSGLTTEVVREPSGLATGIKAPFLQLTKVVVNPGTNLTDSITDAANGTTVLGWDPSAEGLLTSLKDPRGFMHAFDYNDDDGRLETDRDPRTLNTAFPFKTLARSPLTDGYDVNVRTAEQNETFYKVTFGKDGTTTRTVQWPDATKTITTRGADGTLTTSFPDQSSLTVKYDPDPTYGLGAPLPDATLTLPISGKKLELKLEREVSATSFKQRVKEIANPDALLPTTHAATWELTGSNLTVTSPGQRVWNVVLDSVGRVSTITPAQDFAAVSFTYDQGRIGTITQSDRKVVFGYDATNGFLSSITEKVNDVPIRTLGFQDHDGAGRPQTVMLPGNPFGVGLSYDENGNVTSVTPPGKQAHVLGYNEVNLLSSYDPPPPGAPYNKWTYDLDRRVTAVSKPNKLLAAHWEPFAGRLDYVETTEGQIDLSYDGATGQVTALNASWGISTGYEYDGMFPSSSTTTWPGLSAKVSWDRDEFLRVNKEVVDVGYEVSVDSEDLGGFDEDGLVLKMMVAGKPLVLTRYHQTGAPMTLKIGTAELSWTREAVYGELTDIKARVAGTDLYGAHYERDGIGRTKSKVEQVEAAPPVTRIYEYDAAGRLWKEDTTEYKYDSNGNRTAPLLAQCDEQDRIFQYGTRSYVTGEEVVARGTDTFAYDARGNLKSATVDNKTVTYEIDGLGRRVGRTDASGTKRYLYGASIHPIAEIDGGTVSQFVYITRQHVPDLMIKGGQVYALITDKLGSVRLVVNVETGERIQRVDYDAWGNVTPSFTPPPQPFGFAGGLYDPVTRLVHFGAREYEPETGRWTRKEPLGFSGGDTNLYAYCAGDPVNWIDPSGRMKLPPDPSGLGPEWVTDPSHLDPNGIRLRHPSGDYLDFHKGRPGQPGWKGKDHWHRNGEKPHLNPGDDVPDPVPMCAESSGEPEPGRAELDNDLFVDEDGVIRDANGAPVGSWDGSGLPFIPMPWSGPLPSFGPGWVPVW